MDKRKWTAVPKFEEFCKQQAKKKINESNEIGIDVPFWDEAIETTIADCRSIAGEPIEWNTLVKYVKAKYVVLDREITADELMVRTHIKDVLFQNYAASLDLTYDPNVLGAQTITISKLAEEILHRIEVEADIIVEPEQEHTSPAATVSLGYDYDEDDFPFESKNNRKVKGYRQYNKLLNEGVMKLCKMKCVNYDDVVSSTVDIIENQAGGLTYDDVLKAAQQSDGSKDEMEMVKDYIWKVAMEVVAEKGIIKTWGINNDNTAETKAIISKAIEYLGNQIVEDVIDKITKETGVISGNETVK